MTKKTTKPPVKTYAFTGHVVYRQLNPVVLASFAVGVAMRLATNAAYKDHTLIQTLATLANKVDRRSASYYRVFDASKKTRIHVETLRNVYGVIRVSNALARDPDLTSVEVERLLLSRSNPQDLAVSIDTASDAVIQLMMKHNLTFDVAENLVDDLAITGDGNRFLYPNESKFWVTQGLAFTLDMIEYINGIFKTPLNESVLFFLGYQDVMAKEWAKVKAAEARAAKKAKTASDNVRDQRRIVESTSYLESFGFKVLPPSKKVVAK